MGVERNPWSAPVARTLSDAADARNSPGNSEDGAAQLSSLVMGA